MYLTFAKYQLFGGQLSEADFDRFNFKAQKVLDKYTFNRLKDATIDENVERCLYELILYLKSNDNNGSTQAISSVSNDGVSISYAHGKDEETAVKDIITDYMLQTDLMYIGTDGDVGRYQTAPVPDAGYEFLQVRSKK